MSATSPLNPALLQLETAERELAAQLETVTEHLSATRAAIAALRRLPGTRAAPSRPLPVFTSRGKQGSQAAAARERTILRLIGAGTCATPAIRISVAEPAGASAQQHRQSIQNALTRLKAKGFIQPHADGWTLTAAGRKAAAKEEP